MSEGVNGQSRRSMLKRAFVLGAGAVGLGATARSARAQMPVPIDAGREVRLLGRNWRLDTPGRKPGEAIRAGDHGAVQGELVDRPGGKALGQFYGSRLAVPSAPGARVDAGIEVHTFVFPGGTLVGMGTSIRGDAVFAVVGGTGVYAGATGSYVAKQRLREQGGDGTAEFKLTLRS